ncbi:MAG: AAA family ATPase, partial [Candidatus Paceibacterota bacterium]
MKIIQLKSSNIKRLKAIELDIDEKQNIVMITGKNGQGKTSILDSIWYALGGKKAVQDKPIRDGE